MSAGIEVWGRASSINVQKVMWAIGELGLSCTRHDVGGPFGGLDTPEFGAMNPNKLIPVLQDGDVRIWESNAIVRYLSQRYGQGTLYPAKSAALANTDQWMDWSITTLYGDLIPGVFIKMIRVPAAERDHDAVAAAAQRTGARMQMLDELIGARAHLTGDALTMGDIAVGTLLYRYFNLEMERPATPNVERWYAALCERPAYKEHVMHDFSAMKVPGA